MFIVDTTRKTIELHRGDTGAVGFTATGYTFGAADRAVFTMKAADGTVVKEGVFQMTNNRFEIEFKNPDTDYLDPGTYEYDVRYVVSPVFDADGKVVDGQAVGTPEDPMQMMLRRTIGQI